MSRLEVLTISSPQVEELPFFRLFQGKYYVQAWKHVKISVYFVSALFAGQVWTQGVGSNSNKLMLPSFYLSAHWVSNPDPPNPSARRH